MIKENRLFNQKYYRQVHSSSYNLERFYENGEDYFITNNIQQTDNMTKIIFSRIKVELNKLCINFEIEQNNCSSRILSSRDQAFEKIKNSSMKFLKCREDAKFGYENFTKSFVEVKILRFVY